MMIATLYQKIEIRFWDIVIPAMSESAAFQKIIVRASRVARNELAACAALVVSGGLIGLVLGIVVPVAVQSFH